MNVTLRTPKMTREQFLDWVERQEAPYEFDGFEPVPMNGSTVNHDQICQNIYFGLRTRLRGTAWRVLGPTAGLATVGETVRFPDAMVLSGNLSGDERVVPGVVVVFEVVSPTSATSDHHIKLREYAAVSSVLRYVVVESATPDVTAFSRPSPAQGWTATPLLAEEMIELPELGIELPVAELYEDVRFGDRPV